MREPALAHEVVGLDGTFDVMLVDANGNSHIHVLRALGYLTVQFEEIGLFQGLKPEIIESVIPVINDG